MATDASREEISRQAQRIVDANRAKSVMEQRAMKHGQPSEELDKDTTSQITSSPQTQTQTHPQTTHFSTKPQSILPNGHPSNPSSSARGPLSDTGSARKRPRFTRSTAGCLGCRVQKVKCDETKPACLKCIAAERECSWPVEGGRKRRKRGTGSKGSGGSAGSGGSKGGGSGEIGGKEESTDDVAMSEGVFGVEKAVRDGRAKVQRKRSQSGLRQSIASSYSDRDRGKTEDETSEDEDGSEDDAGVHRRDADGDGSGRANGNGNGSGNDHGHSVQSAIDALPDFSVLDTDWSFGGHTVMQGNDVIGSEFGMSGGNNHGQGAVRSGGMLDGSPGTVHTTSGPPTFQYPPSDTPSLALLPSTSNTSGTAAGGPSSIVTNHTFSYPTLQSTGSFLHSSSDFDARPSSVHPHSHAVATSGNNSAAVGTGTVSPTQLLLPRASLTEGSNFNHGYHAQSHLDVNSSTSGARNAQSQSHGDLHSLNSLNNLNSLSSQTGSGTGAGTNPNAISSMLAPSPPQVIDMTKSSLLAKRKDKARVGGGSANGNVVLANQGGGGGGGTQMPDITPAQLRVAMVDMILQAFSYDEGLFEFGPSHRTRNLINNLTTTPINTDFLSLAFPSPAARLLFHHYCNTTSRILITMGNVGPNPLLALCTPLKLLDTASAWAGAIRMSILSISATHFAHETVGTVGVDMLGGEREWEGGKRRRLKELSRKFKKAALCNVYLGTAGDDPHQVDSILAACTLLCIRDVIDADESWQDNLEFAMHLISKRGGPLAMLKAPDTSFTRRYLLENLAVHDVFGCFITGKEPALLGNYDPWWFDSVDSSTTRWEWESVEQTFGISRTVVDLLARIVALDSRKRRLEINLAQNPEEMNDVGQYLYRESQNLMFELDILGNSLSALPQHVRVTCGDYIYKYTAAVYVLADILEEPRTSPRIIRDVSSILELCSEASAMRMSVMLLWPLLIAGTFCLAEMRPKVEELFEVFEPYYAEDLPAARRLLREQWRGMDEGLGKRSWREVMRKMGQYVLLI